MAICATSCAPGRQERSHFNPARDSLPRDEPQPVYGPDRADPWNQVFYLLFTRTLRARLAADDAELFAAGDDRLLVVASISRSRGERPSRDAGVHQAGRSIAGRG